MSGVAAGDVYLKMLSVNSDCITSKYWMIVNMDSIRRQKNTSWPILSFFPHSRLGEEGKGEI
jgi:hypothetical protein